MNGIYGGLREIQNYLKKNKISYMVIGGIGAIAWGEPRSTMDIDITISVPGDKEKETIRKMASEFRISVEKPSDFVKKTRVLPIETSNGVRVDLIFAGLDYETRAIERAVVVEIPKGNPVRVATAEDLIIHKAISPREKDWNDIEGILFRRKARLDKKYILRWLSELSVLLEKPEIVKRFEKLWNDATK